MVREPEAAVSEEQPLPAKKKGKKILFLAALVLGLAAGGGLAYLLLSDDPEAPGPAAPAKAAPPSPGAVMPLEPFLVNLADQESRRYLKLKVELEVDQEKHVKELEKSVSRMRDALILLLSSKTYTEISTQEGKRRLKEEILQRLAALPGGKKVKGVFFTEFVAQ